MLLRTLDKSVNRNELRRSRYIGEYLKKHLSQLFLGTKGHTSSYEYTARDCTTAWQVFCFCLTAIHRGIPSFFRIILLKI